MPCSTLFFLSTVIFLGKKLAIEDCLRFKELPIEFDGMSEEEKTEPPFDGTVDTAVFENMGEIRVNRERPTLEFFSRSTY